MVDEFKKKWVYIEYQVSTLNSTFTSPLNAGQCRGLKMERLVNARCLLNLVNSPQTQGWTQMG